MSAAMVLEVLVATLRDAQVDERLIRQVQDFYKTTYREAYAHGQADLQETLDEAQETDT